VAVFAHKNVALQVTGGKALPREIADQIVDRTDGVPLFIEELTKAVLESGILTETDDCYAVTGAVAPLAIPTTLHASLLARLDRLAPTREVAQISAALGRQFSDELIRAVATMPNQQLDDALAMLVRAELIFRRGTPPDAEYTFKHALVQDAACGTLLRSRRQQLHARIAATLEDEFPEIAVGKPALLARHYAEAGMAEEAVGYWLKAGQQALERSAMTEAVAQLQKGLDLLAGLPETPWRRQHELDLKVALLPALTGTKGYSAFEVAEAIARARTLAQQIDRPEYLVPLLLSQSAFHLLRSEHKLALSIAEEIEEIGERRNDVVTQSLGLRAKGWACWYLGEFVAARALLEQGLDLAGPAHRVVSGKLSDPYAEMLAHLAVTLLYLGYIDRARSRMKEALSEARRLGHAHMLADVLAQALGVDGITGSPEMQRHVEELLALSTEHGFPFFFGLRNNTARMVVDCARASTGRPPAAHAGAGGGTGYRSCCGYAGNAHRACRRIRYARSAGRRTEMPRRGCADYRDDRRAVLRSRVASGARRVVQRRRKSNRGRTELPSGARGCSAAERQNS
jgi:hypothetical protein